MKNLGWIAIGLLSFLGTAHAQKSAFPDDTLTRIQSKGADCGAGLDISSAYFTQFNDFSGRTGRAVIMNIYVKNDAYEKKIQITDQEGHSNFVTYTGDWSHNLVSAIYGGQTQGYDVFTLVNRATGASNFGIYTIKATMNGRTYTCSNVQVSVKAE